MKQEHIEEIQGILIFALGLILLASFVSFTPADLPWYTSNPNVPAQNLIRIVGAYTAGAFFFVFGYSVYALVVFLFFWSWNKFVSRELEFTPAKLISCLILLCVISALLSMFGVQESAFRFERGGLVGFLWADFLIRYLGTTGAFIILLTLGTMTLVVASELLVSPFVFRLTEIVQEWAAVVQEKAAEQKKKLAAAPSRAAKVKPRFFRPKEEEEDEEDDGDEEYEDEEEEYEDDEEYEEEENEQPRKSRKPNIKIAKEEEAAHREYQPKIIGEYHLPSLDLLNSAPQVSKGRIQSDLENGARMLESTLQGFGVNVRVVDIERGPVVTRFELEPGPGVKVQKITTLSNDIALAMRAAAVRIEAPIPGKNRVGIEVPNSSTAAVFLKDVLAQPDFHNAKSKLTLAIGKDITGKSMIADLAEMPHLLIAGTTGAGKTVCVNALIMSMVYNASPDDVKFLMVDPKMVELAQYNDLPHMLIPAVTDTKKVASALNWLVGEMEARYQTLSKSGARNITSYHAKGHHMPYIVVIVDELADLMQVAAKTIEGSIARLAQLSRAVGIHLILATQRPSVDVITGVIKANFPARISFKVASKVDSRTVLDMNGAESLLGKGDLLFIKPGDAKPRRGQCSFVSDDEVHRVIEFIKNQGEPDYNEEITKHRPGSGPGGEEERDEMFDEAVQLVIQTNQASVSVLQRRLRLGYTRAARLIDQMEQAGIVGPYCGSKAREILVDREEWMMENMKSTEEA